MKIFQALLLIICIFLLIASEIIMIFHEEIEIFVHHVNLNKYESFDHCKGNLHLCNIVFAFFWRWLEKKLIKNRQSQQKEDISGKSTHFNLNK